MKGDFTRRVVDLTTWITFLAASKCTLPYLVNCRRAFITSWCLHPLQWLTELHGPTWYLTSSSHDPTSSVISACILGRTSAFALDASSRRSIVRKHRSLASGADSVRLAELFTVEVRTISRCSPGNALPPHPSYQVWYGTYKTVRQYNSMIYCIPYLR